MRELDLLDAVRLQNLDEKLSVVLFFQIQVTLLVARIRQVLRQFLNLFGKILKTAEILLLRTCLFGWSARTLDRLSIGTVLYTCASISGLSVGGGLLSLFGILVFLEIFLGHFTLYNHQARIYKRFFE